MNLVGQTSELTDGAADEAKARYTFIYGDFRRPHRTALIASIYRASGWRHKEIELAAYDLLGRTVPHVPSDACTGGQIDAAPVPGSGPLGSMTESSWHSSSAPRRQ